MADLAVIALGLDATGMKTGADQANRALGSVEKEMDSAQKKITELEKQLGTTGKSFTAFGGSTKNATAALSGLGGPVGQAAGQLQNLDSQLAGLIESFGLVGGAAVAAVAGVAALGAALVKFTLDGVKVSDEMGDLAEVTGFSLDTIQRFGAGMELAGESLGSIEKPLRTFQSLVQAALIDPSGDAAIALFHLGTNARIANNDIEAAFKKIVVNVKELRTTTEGVVATNDLFGRSIGAIVRSSDILTGALTGNRQALEDSFTLATQKAAEKGQELDTKINKLSHSWTVFTQNLANSVVGDSVSNSFDTITTALNLLGEANKAIENQIKGSLYLQVLYGFAKASVGALPAAAPIQPQVNIGAPSRADLFGLAPPPPKPTKEKREKEPPNLPTSFDPLISKGMQRAFDLINAMQDANKAAAKAAFDAAHKLPEVVDTIADIFHRLGLPTFAGAAAPPTTAGAIPGTRSLIPLPPDQILGPRQQRIEDALGGIFEDFVFQITTARGTVGDAFKGLLLGITDTFAQEFAKAVQESLRDAFIKPLASWLEDALKGIFEGIDLKGVSKFFLTLGKSFVGAFAEGGTIAPGHWGLVGERGPEIAFAGGTPMHIQPMGGGGSVTMNFAISTASGEVSQRTQDQIADAAARGIERASRIRGAR